MPARLGLALVILALAAGACSDRRPSPAAIGEAEPTTTVPPTTIPPTTAAGRPRTTTTIPAGIAGGQARIAGNVLGPQGAVAGANVRIERIVGSEVAGTDVSAGGGGSFSLGDVRGGRYRLRAWKQPDLFQVEPEVFFLGSDENKTVDLRLVKTGEVAVRTTVDPTTLPAADPFAITVFLYAGSVGGQGELRAIPRSSVAVQLVPGPGFAVVGTDKAVTDGAGNVTFRARCTKPGAPGGDVIVSTFRLPLELPTCPG